MQVESTPLAGLAIIEPRVFGDARGFFFESFNEKRFADALGLPSDLAPRFVQDNHSQSAANVVRGLHYQIRQQQGKLVRVIAGEIFDVVVDLRRSSPTFGQWHGTVLSADNKRQLWIPEGFAHGFAVAGDGAEVFYKTTDYWAPEHERCLLWDDPAIGIDWPLQGEPLLSDKDRLGKHLSECEVFA